MTSRQQAELIYLAGIKGVLPGKLITAVMKREGNTLITANERISLDGVRNIYVIGAGKASAAMGHYVETILTDRITEGHIVVKYGFSCRLKKISVSEAGHPVPDINGFKATREIIRIAEKAEAEDLVIFLISGGGSALMADLPEGLIPEELYIVNNLLVRCGADINEINSVRKHLSKVKGGQLARIVKPARLVTIMISDVTGNLPEVIASGPTVPDSSTFHDALRVIERYNLTADLTSGVVNYLKEGAAGNHPETVKPGDPVFDGNLNIIAGTILTALRAAKTEAIQLGYNSFIIDDEMKGDIETVCDTILNTAVTFKGNPDIKKPVCLLFGGETTIRVAGSGKGGRNQHLALTAAAKLQHIPGITVLAAGTDGNDGSTDAAGAVAGSYTIGDALAMNIDPYGYLREFDSWNFFRKAGGLVITGPTFTNVMDMVVVLVE